ncbi:MAG: metal ABC transporter ATP-binding protein [Candidatus Brocadiales bacterium]|nr:metal ABC transporter ATP-binding protein [Candidatus Brocadiales bacterium]
MNKRLIEFQDVELGYGRQVVLNHVNLNVEEGDFLGIAGPNGSGKTTILRALLKMLKPRRGSIRFREDIRRGKMSMGYVPQREFLDEIYPLTVMDVVMMGRYASIGLVGKPKKEDYFMVHDALAHVNMEGQANTAFRDLSGGQKQRVLVARALAGGPIMLVLDEPTDGLDIAGEREVMELLRDLHENHNLTVLMVSHHLNVMANYVKKLAIIDEATLHVGTLEAILTEENLEKIYSMKVKIFNVDGQKAILHLEHGNG